MDQTEEITAEFKIEEVKGEAEKLESSPQAPMEAVAQPAWLEWIPVAAGLVTLAVMVWVAYHHWLP